MEEGIAAATLRLFSNEQLRETRSAADGKFEFSDLPPDDYSLEVVAPGYTGRIVHSITIPNRSNNPQTIILSPGQECGISSNHYGAASSSAARPNLDGLVAEYGTGIRLRRVEMVLAAEHGARVIATVTSNDAGGFIFPVIPPGLYRLKAHHEGFHDEQQTNVVLTRRNKTHIEVRMARGSDGCLPMRTEVAARPNVLA